MQDARTNLHNGWRIRKMPVGVDAHIDPAMRNCRIAHTIGEHAHRLVGADDPVRPLGNNKFAVTYRKKRNIPRPYANLAVVANHPNCAILRVPRAGRCGHRPLQTWCVFAGMHSFLWVRPAGRTESSAPTARSGMQSKFAAAGGASPSPTLRRNVAAAQKFVGSDPFRRFAPPSRCGSVTAWV